MKKKKEPTTDAIEILKRHFGYGLIRRFSLWRERRKLRKEKEAYAEGYNRGYNAGYGNGYLEAGGKGLMDENGPVEKVEYEHLA